MAFTLVLGTDGDNSTQTGWKPPMAPATLHYNIPELEHGQHLNHQINVTAIDASGHLIDSLPHSNGAFILDNPGTYTITAKIDAAATATKVTIAPDTRQNIFIDSDAALAKLKLTSNINLFLKRAVTFTEHFVFNGLHNVRVGSYGNATDPLAHILVSGGNVVSFWTDSKDISLRNLRIDSTWTPAVTVDGYAYHMANALFGNIRGTNISFLNLEFANLRDGATLLDPVMHGFLAKGCRQVEPLGMQGRNFMLDSGTDIVLLDNIATNSVNESPIRATGTGVTRGLFHRNTISQLLDPKTRPGAKAAITIRQATDLAMVQNNVIDGEFSLDYGGSNNAPGQPITQLIKWGRISHNTLTRAKFTVRPGADHCLYEFNTINTPDSECFSIEALADAGNIIRNNTMSSKHSGLDFRQPSTTYVMGNKFHALDPSAKSIVGDTSKMVDQGGNVVV